MAEAAVDVFDDGVVDYRAVGVVDGAVAADEELGGCDVGFGLLEEVTECCVGLEDVEDSFGRVETGDLDDVFICIC